MTPVARSSVPLAGAANVLRTQVERAPFTMGSGVPKLQPVDVQSQHSVGVVVAASVQTSPAQSARKRFDAPSGVGPSSTVPLPPPMLSPPHPSTPSTAPAPSRKSPQLPTGAAVVNSSDGTPSAHGSAGSVVVVVPGDPIVVVVLAGVSTVVVVLSGMPTVLVVTGGSVVVVEPIGTVVVVAAGRVVVVGKGSGVVELVVGTGGTVVEVDGVVDVVVVGSGRQAPASVQTSDTLLKNVPPIAARVASHITAPVRSRHCVALRFTLPVFLPRTRQQITAPSRCPHSDAFTSRLICLRQPRSTSCAFSEAATHFWYFFRRVSVHGQSAYTCARTASTSSHCADATPGSSSESAHTTIEPASSRRMETFFPLGGRGRPRAAGRLERSCAKHEDPQDQWTRYQDMQPWAVEGTRMAVASSRRAADLAAAPADIRAPATILGVGLGGFADGILLHQVLQWHHMLSATGSDNVGLSAYPVDTVAGLQMNTLWDGFFHVFTWLAVLTGLGMLYARVVDARGALWSSRVLWGWVLVGWGLFNVVEGLIDHHLLAIHHVRPGPYQTWWDVGFLVLGVVLIAGGWLLQRTGVPVPVGAVPRRP